jgi:hypothetical protein
MINMINVADKNAMMAKYLFFILFALCI